MCIRLCRLWRKTKIISCENKNSKLLRLSHEGSGDDAAVELNPRTVLRLKFALACTTEKASKCSSNRIALMA